MTAARSRHTDNRPQREGGKRDGHQALRATRLQVSRPLLGGAGDQAVSSRHDLHLSAIHRRRLDRRGERRNLGGHQPGKRGFGAPGALRRPRGLSSRHRGRGACVPRVVAPHAVRARGHPATGSAPDARARRCARAHDRARIGQAVPSGARRVAGRRGPLRLVRRGGQARVRPHHPVAGRRQAHDRAAPAAGRHRRHHRVELPGLQSRLARGPPPSPPAARSSGGHPNSHRSPQWR